MALLSRSLPAPLLALLAAAACATAPAAEPAGAPPPPAAAHAHPAMGAAPADTARWTPADVHFMSAMIAHHAQAIDMARLAPTHGASPSMLILTARIINAQQDEIATMQQWLRDRGQPVPEATAAPMMHDGHAMTMPGMLTAEQMRQLDAARGAEFDRLFLTFMIQHHRGAVSMVHDLFGSAGAGQDDTVFKVASDINVDQLTEIARMQRMLADLILAGPSQ